MAPHGGVWDRLWLTAAIVISIVTMLMEMAGLSGYIPRALRAGG